MSFAPRPTTTAGAGRGCIERKVSFAYRFNDIAYTSVHASFSSNSPTTSPWVLRLRGMDFQDGAGVKVFVNPANPSEATLDPRVKFGWLLWVVALGLWAGAYWIATAG